MDNYFVTFKYQGQLAYDKNNSFSDKELISEIIGLLKLGGVAMLEYGKDHNLEIDNHADVDEPVLENETIVEVRLAVYDQPSTDYAIDWHDGGDDFFHYVLEALELRQSFITFYYENGDKPFQKTKIGIEIKD